MIAGLAVIVILLWLMGLVTVTNTIHVAAGSVIILLVILLVVLIVGIANKR